jgi:hypothetical protein
MKNLIVSRILEVYAKQDNSFSYLEDFTKFIPDSGYALEMSIDTFSLSFPLKGYKVYSIRLSNWKQVEGAQKRAISSRLNSECFEIDCSRPYMKSWPLHDNFYTYLKNNYLIAYNKLNDSILYLSGKFYIDSYYHLFSLDLNSPSSFFDYLNFRLFMYSPKGFDFEGYSKECIWFSVKVNWSPYNKIIYVGLDKFDFDRIIVQYSKPVSKRKFKP